MRLRSRTGLPSLPLIPAFCCKRDEVAGSLGHPRIYWPAVRIVKIRRVGNSNVVSIPREFEAQGFTPGTSVLMEETADGELRILPTEKVREQIRQVGRRLVDEHREALRILAEHGPIAKPRQRR